MASVAPALLIALSVLFSASGNMLFKAGTLSLVPYGVSGLSPISYGLHVLGRPQIALGIVCYIATFPTWLSVLKRLDLSVAYPVFVSGAFTVATVGAMVFFHEQVTPLRVLGMAVVFAGICLVYSTK